MPSPGSALAATLKNIHDPAAKLQQAKTDLRRLEDLRLARQELGNTIPMSAVIQQLQNDMTRGMALSSVNVEVRPEPVRGSGVVGDPKNPLISPRATGPLASRRARA